MPTKVARTEGGISVERLTTHKNENYNQPGCNDCSDYRWRSCQESGEIDDCIQRLTWIRLLAIEDILGDEYDLDRLRELAQADRDGRCVVLPCKQGDTVWRICGPKGRKFVAERKVVSVTMYEPGRFAIFTNCDDWLGETVFLTQEEAEKRIIERR